jgi:hypothetical protein
MTSDARRTRSRRRRQPVLPTLVPEPEPPKPWRDRPTGEKVRDASGVLLLVGWVALFFVADEIGRAWIELARGVTGGNAQGMAVAGWAIYFTPFGALLGLVARGLRLDNPVAYVLGTLVAVLTPLAWHLAPTEFNGDLREMISGPGGGGFVSGLLNGALGGIVSVTLVAVFAVSDQVRESIRADAGARWTVIGGISLFAVATLIAAVILA